MNSSIQTIPFANLAIIFIPVLITIGILYKWSLNFGNAFYSVVRMLIQLLLVGYCLAYIFESKNAGLILLILAVMLIASSWIALGSIRKEERLALFK